ncbi:hypothetical protein KUTeg_023084 [Tegillarca granosa]|uniref:Uncharacterized protein n=1 Tax=Tegillarca granosa TaxID=220873 RepID=A0ABQ9E493_TEGGR|nr:hypothetical protein KUTeg_023084 [Tegillarca granosa]
MAVDTDQTRNKENVCAHETSGASSDLLYFNRLSRCPGSYPVYTKRGTIVVQSIKNSKAKFSQSVTLSAEERETLKKLAETNDIYRLRIPFDQSGEVLGVSIATYPSQCEGIQVDNAYLTTWNTTVDVSSTSQGPTGCTLFHLY